MAPTVGGAGDRPDPLCAAEVGDGARGAARWTECLTSEAHEARRPCGADVRIRRVCVPPRLTVTAPRAAILRKKSRFKPRGACEPVRRALRWFLRAASRRLMSPP